MECLGLNKSTHLSLGLANIISITLRGPPSRPLLRLIYFSRIMAPSALPITGPYEPIFFQASPEYSSPSTPSYSRWARDYGISTTLSCVCNWLYLSIWKPPPPSTGRSYSVALKVCHLPHKLWERWCLKNYISVENPRELLVRFWFNPYLCHRSSSVGRTSRTSAR